MPFLDGLVARWFQSGAGAVAVGGPALVDGRRPPGQFGLCRARLSRPMGTVSRFSLSEATAPGDRLLMPRSRVPDLMDRLLDRLIFLLSRQSERRIGQWLLAYFLAMAVIAICTPFLIRAEPTAYFLILVLLLFSTFAGLIFGAAALQKRIDKIRFASGGSLEKIRQLRFEEFERFVAVLYVLRGYQVELRGGDDADGGVDLVVVKRGKKYVVQCKQWRDERVPPKDIRELVGVVRREGAHGGYFVTSGEFSEASRTEFENHDLIKLVDGHALLQIASRLRERQPSLGETSSGLGDPELDRAVNSIVAASRRVPVELTISVPACPHCGALMHVQYSDRRNERFWACPNYRRSCRGSTKSLSRQEIEILDHNRRKPPRPQGAARA